MKICCKSSRMEETMEEKLWNVSSSPHVRDHSSTQSIMRDVVIALLPATIIGIYNFRLSAVLVILTCCVSCMLAEYIWQRLMKQKVTTNDFSALLTGLLLALNQWYKQVADNDGKGYTFCGLTEESEQAGQKTK